MDKKILIVDDEPAIRQMLNDLLKNEGFSVLEAADGKKGLDEAKKHVPDLVVLDVNMPKMDGFKVLENLKKDKKTRDIPVIMLTSKSSQEDITQGIQLYADKYIPKPFDAAHFLTEVKKTFQARGIF